MCIQDNDGLPNKNEVLMNCPITDLRINQLRLENPTTGEMYWTFTDDSVRISKDPISLPLVKFKAGNAQPCADT